MVKRYDPEIVQQPYTEDLTAEMEQDDRRGRYVEYIEYLKLEQKYDELLKEHNELKDKASCVIDEHDALYNAKFRDTD